MTPEIVLESENIVSFAVQMGGETEHLVAHPLGISDFEKFVREQKVGLNEKLTELKSKPPSTRKHDGRFKSLTEMRNAYAGRDKAIAYAEYKLLFLQTGGEVGEAMTLNYNDKGELVGFEVVKLD